MDVITETSESPPRKSSMHTPTTSISMSSPVASVFSRGHSAKGSNSSIASSPIPRDSFDLYTSRLGKVTEEPLERDDFTSYSFDDDPDRSYDQYFTSDRTQTSPRNSAIIPEYSLGEQDEWDISSGQQQPKRQRSCDNGPSVSNRLSSRFNSISRRWRNRSGASPQLSIVTHVSAPVSRHGSAASSRIMSPALSAISRHESYLPPSPTRTNLRCYDTFLPRVTMAKQAIDDPYDSMRSSAQ